MLKNTQDHYGSVARSLHWIIAFFFLGLFATMWMVEVLPEEHPLIGTLFMIHKSLGTTLMPLILLRIFWRFYSPAPQSVPMPIAMDHASQIVHGLLYAIMLSQPISGFLMSILSGYSINLFQLFTIPALKTPNLIWGKAFNQIHVWTALAIYGVVGIHIIAALYHHFIRKDNTLIRMITGSKI
jgi:cytochrome b561